MKSKTIFIIAASVVGAALIAAGVWFFLIQPNMPNPNANIAGAGQEINTNVGSIEQAVAVNGPFACSWNDGEGEATFYIVSEDKMRSDYVSNDPQNTSGGMIIADGYLYSWETGTKEGFKMPHTPADDLDEEDEFIPNFDENAEQDGSYKCYRWSVDNTKFTPPSDVEFIDFTDMQNFV